MICPNCKNKVEKEWIYCDHCGKLLSTDINVEKHDGNCSCITCSSKITPSPVVCILGILSGVVVGLIIPVLVVKFVILAKGGGQIGHAIRTSSLFWGIVVPLGLGYVVCEECVKKLKEHWCSYKTSIKK